MLIYWQSVLCQLNFRERTCIKQQRQTALETDHNWQTKMVVCK